MKVLRLFVLGWMLLWLAGSGVLAAAMPFCKHTLGQHGDAAVVAPDHHQSAQQDIHSSHQHDQHEGLATDHHGGKSGGLIGFVCDSCDLCHLATSIVPTASLANGIVLTKRVHPVGPDVTVPSRFLEQPQPVPLAQRA